MSILTNNYYLHSGHPKNTINYEKIKFPMTIKSYCTPSNGLINGVHRQIINGNKIHVEKRSICEFIQVVCTKCFKFELLGCNKNWGLFFKGINKFIQLTSIDKLDISNITEKFNFEYIKYYNNMNSFNDLIFFIFSQFIGSLIRGYFYATEISNKSNHNEFYRKDMWFEMVTNNLVELTKSGFIEPINAENDIDAIKLRFVPKSDSLRPIFNLGNKRDPLSANKLLEPLFLLLKKIKVGNNVDSVGTLFNRFVKFKLENDECPRFYVVKCDLVSFFDWIDRTRLLKILDSEISSFCASHGISDSFERHKTSLKNLFDSPVSIYNMRFKTKRGVLQGSIVAKQLGDFYLRDLESNLNLVDCSDKILLRHVDDTLFITTNHRNAVKFVTEYTKLLSQYNLHLNGVKSCANFQIPEISFSESIPWFGHLLTVNSLEFSLDIPRRMEKKNITHNEGNTWIQTIRKVMQPFTGSSVMSYLMDSRITKFSTLVSNLYELGVVVCAKLFYGLLRRANKREIYFKLDWIILTLSRRFYRAVNKVNTNVWEGIVEWIVGEAMICVLRLKMNGHRKLIRKARRICKRKQCQANVEIDAWGDYRDIIGRSKFVKL